MRPLFASVLAISAALFGSLTLGACGDSSTDPQGGGGAGGGGEGLSNPGRICVDNARGWTIPEYSGIHMKFRVLDENGDPVRPLVLGDNAEGDVTIFNDETSAPFGVGEAEGYARIALDDPSQIELYSVLALDLSDSIFSDGKIDDVIDGGRAYVQQALSPASSGGFPHQIAILAVGAPNFDPLVLDFTDDQEDLLARLEQLRGPENNRGTTDLYGTYVEGLDMLDAQVSTTDLVIERFLVLITDGEHEAGNSAALREYALSRKDESSSTKITIGIQGNYDACALEELAGQPIGCQDPLKGCRIGITCSPDVPQPPSCTQFIPDVAAADIASVFQGIAERAQGIARSNYKAGICSPIAIGTGFLTLLVDVDGAQDSEKFQYDASIFSGFVNECIENFDDQILNIDIIEGGGGAGGGGGGTGGTGGAGGAGGAAGGGGTGGV